MRCDKILSFKNISQVSHFGNPNIILKKLCQEIISFTKNIWCPVLSSYTLQSTLPCDNEQTSVWYYKWVFWAPISEQNISNILFNELPLMKFTILTLLFNTSLKFSESLFDIRACQCIKQWFQIALSAASKNLLIIPLFCLAIFDTLSFVILCSFSSLIYTAAQQDNSSNATSTSSPVVNSVKFRQHSKSSNISFCHTYLM